jgi:hypothetical protein
MKEVRDYANRCTGTARVRNGKALRQLQSSAAFILVIILLGVPARPQSVPRGQASANDLARRVITNELKFQDDHTNWMYRLEKEQYGKRNRWRKSLRQKKVLSVDSCRLTTAPYRETTEGRGPACTGVNDQSKCETKIAASPGS